MRPPRSDEVADRLVGRVRRLYSSQFAGSMQPRQRDRISPVCLDPLVSDESLGLVIIAGLRGVGGHRPPRAADGARPPSGDNRGRALGPPPLSRTTVQSLDWPSHEQGRLP